MLPTLIIPAPTQWIPLQPNCTHSDGNNVTFGAGKMESGSGFVISLSLLPVLLTENNLQYITAADNKVNMKKTVEK